MSSNNIYPSSSPYALTTVVDNAYLDVMINRPIPMQPSDNYWEITSVYQFRPDMLAYDLYSNGNLWWVFAQRNPNTLKDPYFDFVTGLGIYIPKIEVIQQALGI
jgi:hypothetical protein